MIFGLDPIAGGEVRLHGRPFVPTPRRCIRGGVSFLTEDRREEGLLMEAGVVQNASLVALPTFTQTPLRLVDRWRLRDAVGEAADSVRLRVAPAARPAARALSGGNQQKLVLAKWLLARPSVMLLDEPTRGIDIGAKHEVYRTIEALVEGGAGVLLISSEIEELIGMCDRILVMASGRVRDVVPRPEFDRERILRAALKVHGTEEPAE
jgi:ribose transport system ATP-binding protein